MSITVTRRILHKVGYSTMSLPHQYGYTSYVSSGSPLTSSQLLPPASSSSSSPTMASPCCENGRSLVNPHTGQTVCSCQYPAGLLTYSRVGLTDPVYSTPAYSTPQAYMPLGTDPSAFYPSLNSPYELKEAGETWRSIGQPPGCYPYDPTSMHPYPYPNAFGGMDINNAARRKNATRENTNTLKAWLYEHRKNPYPTKGEKIMLAIITKMTLTQVSTWFANARRRLKKENKMTWSPRNKPGDSDDVDDDDSKEKGDNVDSDDESMGKSPKDEKKACDRENHPRDDCTASSPPSFSRRMNDPVTEPPHRVASHPNTRCHLGETELPRHGSNYSLHPECQTSFLHLPPATHGYGSLSNGCSSGSAVATNGTMTSTGSVLSTVDSTSSLKSPDSVCSNSDDSGLSDVNYGYPDAGHGSMDGMRPKIWSLAHVATSDAGYVQGSHNGMNHGSMTRNLSTQARSLQMAPGLNGGMTPNHMGNSHLGHDGGQSIIPPSPLLSSSGLPTPSSMPPIQCGIPQWGPMYGSSNSLGSSFGKPSCQGPIFSQPLPSMQHGGHLGQQNSLVSLHCSSPTSSYNPNLGTSLGYYNNSKSTME